MRMKNNCGNSDVQSRTSTCAKPRSTRTDILTRAILQACEQEYSNLARIREHVDNRRCQFSLESSSWPKNSSTVCFRSQRVGKLEARPSERAGMREHRCQLPLPTLPTLSCFLFLSEPPDSTRSSPLSTRPCSAECPIPCSGTSSRVPPLLGDVPSAPSLRSPER